MVDFDDIDGWSAELGSALQPCVSEATAGTLVAAAPELIEDARDLLFDLADRDAVIDKTLAWIRSTSLVGYHGSRLVDAEVASVRKEGLVPLRALERRDRLARALSLHPRWSEVEGQLDATLQAYGGSGVAGSREGQVHLTLSRSGLLNGFAHYLTHGAEFDQHVAHALLGPEGVELLATDGDPRVFRVVVRGDLALEAAHPIFSIYDLRRRGDVPNLVNAFLKSWSFRLAYPGFQSRTLRTDSGMVFRHVVPAAWVVGVETLTL